MVILVPYQRVVLMGCFENRSSNKKLKHLQKQHQNCIIIELDMEFDGKAVMTALDSISSSVPLNLDLMHCSFLQYLMLAKMMKYVLLGCCAQMTTQPDGLYVWPFSWKRYGLNFS
jgi:hypothetical protein